MDKRLSNGALIEEPRLVAVGLCDDIPALDHHRQRSRGRILLPGQATRRTHQKTGFGKPDWISSGARLQGLDRQAVECGPGAVAKSTGLEHLGFVSVEKPGLTSPGPQVWLAPVVSAFYCQSLCL